MARSCEQLIGFGTAFFHARLVAIGSIGNLVSGDDAEQFIPGASEGEDRGREQRRPLPEGVDGALEAEPIERDRVGPGGFEHECANQVVAEDLHPDFLLHQLGRAAAQDIHAQGDLDVAEKQFHRPAPAVKGGDRFIGIDRFVEQRRGQDDLLGAEAGNHDSETDQAHGQLFRQLVPEALGPAVLSSRRLFPIRPRFLGRALRVQAHDDIHAFALEQRHETPAAKAAVGQHDLARLHPGDQLPGERDLVRAPRVEGEAPQPSSRQTEQPHQLRGRKTATRPLIAGVRPSPPVFRRVRHRESGPVDHLDRAPAPQISFVLLEPSAEFFVRRPERLDLQTRARLAIGARVLVGNRLVAGARPRLYPPHRLPAGASSAEHLPQKGDERHPGRIHTPAPALFRFEYLWWNEATNQRRQAVERVGLPRQSLRLRPTAAQQMRKPGKI